ncbi:HlyD family secretion protein [Rhabdaerophilum calidifontis]|uniref:HlyD family secretion protein n=1 Tax=Rhabdaerophilum calidifontis TaxID=2604328 RepID=UPI001409B73D|nr:efflux RND transporter periplasmic adaptor subunit [Rhabdaerophilum calidifontis]
MRKAFLILAVLVAGLGAWAFASRKAEERADAGQRFRVEKIERGSIIAAVSATGTVTPTTTVIVGSQLSGQVVEILADYNSQVKAGQVLARLNRDTLTARLDGARADLAQARAARQLTDAQAEKNRADLRRAEATLADMQAQRQRAQTMFDDAETTFERQQALKARGIASDVALQSATTQRDSQAAAIRSAEAQIASSRAQIAALDADLKVIEAQKRAGDAQVLKAEAQVRQIEVDLANSEIRSPVDGVVIQRNVELGQTVAASLQSPTLFLVAQDLKLIEIYVNLDEADVGRVQPGQEVEFSVNAYPARTFRGRVKQIRLGSQNVQNVVIYTTVVEVANEDMALLPGMTANLRIFTDRKADVLRIPNAALRWQPAGTPRAAGSGAGNAGPPAPGEDGAGPFAGPAGDAAAAGGSGPRPVAAIVEGLTRDLKLAPEQVREVEALATRMRAEIAAAGSDPNARREMARQARQRFTRAVEELLTPEQRGAYRALAEARRQRASGAMARSAGGVPGRVFVPDEKGNPRAVNVRLGANDGSFTEMLSGDLRAGDSVITGLGAAGKLARPSSSFRFGL